MRRLIAFVSLLMPAVTLGQEAPPLIPRKPNLSTSVRAAVDDKALSDAERRKLRLFHGLFDERYAADRITPEFLLATWSLEDPSLGDEKTQVMIRAEAALMRGQPDKTIDLLVGDLTPPARLLTGRAAMELGRGPQAIESLSPLRESLKRKELTTAADRTAALEAMAMLAMLEGKPAADYQWVMDGLGQVQQQIDRLYWPAILAQARLLMDKDNPEEAVAALKEVLRFNPLQSDALYMLGLISINSYNFGVVAEAQAKLREINPTHLLAELLEAELLLMQRDPVAAEKIAEESLKRFPGHRHLMACAIAAKVLKYDGEGAQKLFELYNKVSPGNPTALYLTGKYMSLARQYQGAEKLLSGAVALQPNWPGPHIELGLLLNQAGKEEDALLALRKATSLDPFNKRAANTQKMLEAVTGYKQIQTAHFIIKYRDEIDGALAADMPEVLERIYNDVTAVFAHKPQAKTLIEIMPDKRWFAIRITGMPFIWTIGASTGPVIALTPPREGANHAGPYDWARVIRHEFTHTVTLDQTANRIPHWFTEAAAVAQEPGPRDYQTAKMLAEALADDELFTLENINWAFVRPKKKNDRALAYGQAHWMYEYLTTKFGHRTVLKALEFCRSGTPQNEIVPKATGKTAEQFLAGFKDWARDQVRSWGLNAQPPAEQLLEELKKTGTDKLAEKIEDMLKKHPDHPDLLELAAHAAIDAGADESVAYATLLRYAAARPVDPWADRQLAELAIRMGQPQQAVGHLEQLDRLDQSNGDHAAELAGLYQKLGQFDAALPAAERALYRQPYDPKLRESAATIALQAGDTDTALRHLKALTLIEPDRSIHWVRLAALYAKLNRGAESKSAAQSARKLDPAAPVDGFLK